ncbi:hypothetical protein L1987_61837 [Smallanthus sonchifolius]|uniref:Uncharacterized protein n=1 Tax=Smallanthus sonchifolius TaxID=185202 RepID=A0ACB9C8W2_9ASTR|nr:hypothetical protein L1987_61837 [Smallanthus sonchifolius]
MMFSVNEAARLQNHLTLVVKIKAVRMLVNKKLGEVRVPIKELLEGETMRAVGYLVRGWQGEEKGFVTFSYRLGKILHATAPKKAAVRRKRKSSSGMGLATGLVAGMALGSVANSGGCGEGGGCGGCGG